MISIQASGKICVSETSQRIKYLEKTHDETHYSWKVTIM